MINWQDGSTSATFIADQTGIYSLSISNNCGIQSDQLSLSYDNQEIQWPVIDSFKICPGERVMPDVTQNFDADYHWSDGSSLPLLTVTAADQYTVTITSGCQKLSKTFIVQNKNDCSTQHDFFIPNIFSPNGDNINDVFVVRMNDGLKILTMEGSIFDRWGNLVFRSETIPFSWSGEFSDHRVLPGVYVYAIKFSYELNKEFIKENLTGDITEVR